MPIKALVERLRSWFSDELPTTHLLRDGASDAEIGQLRQAFDQDIPEPVCQLLRQTNGSEEGAIAGYELLSVRGILRESRLMIEMAPTMEANHGGPLNIDADRGVKSVWWSKDWMPLLRLPHGSMICVDLSPTASGDVGQLVHYLLDEPRRILVAASLQEWLEQFVTEIEDDIWLFDDELGALRSIAD